MKSTKIKISDGHAHIGPKFFQVSKWRESFPARRLAEEGLGIRDVRKELKRFGINRAVLMSFPFSEYNLQKVNAYIGKIAKKSKGKFVGVGVIDVEKDISGQIRLIQKQGLKAIKIHPMQARGNPEVRRALFKKALSSIFMEAQKKQLPLIIHSDFRDTLINLKDFPNTITILAHCGRGWTGIGVHERRSILKKFAQYKQAYFDTSTVTDISFLKDVIEIIGSRRVLFGSDIPYTKEPITWSANGVNAKDFGSAQLHALSIAMSQLKLTNSQKENILNKNFDRIF